MCPELLVRKEQLAFQVIVMFENYTNSIQESGMVKWLRVETREREIRI